MGGGPFRRLPPLGGCRSPDPCFILGDPLHGGGGLGGGPRWRTTSATLRVSRWKRLILNSGYLPSNEPLSPAYTQSRRRVLEFLCVVLG